MASGGAIAVESPARRDLARMPSSECPAEALRKADSLHARSSISLHAASSGDAGPPRHKRARRDAVRRVWDWLDMSMSREASAGLAQAGEAVAFGQMHLSEGSPATTVITATLDVSPGDAVEPCVSSLPDGQAHVGDIMCVSSKPSASVAPQAPEEGTRAEEQRHTCPPCTKVGDAVRSSQGGGVGDVPLTQEQLSAVAAGADHPHLPCSQQDDSAADRSLQGPAYQRQGSSRKRKHGSPAPESPKAAGAAAQAAPKEVSSPQPEDV